MTVVVFAPGAVAAGNSIDLPDGSPPIDRIVHAELFRGSDATNPAESVAATATKVDENTITLDVDTTTRDLLVLEYHEVGVLMNPEALK